MSNAIEKLNAEIAETEAKLAELRQQKADASKTYGQRVAEGLIWASGPNQLALKDTNTGGGLTSHYFSCTGAETWLPGLRAPIAAAMDKARADRTEDIVKHFEALRDGKVFCADLARSIRELK